MNKEHFFKVLFETVADIMIMPEADKLLCLQYFEPVCYPKNTIVESVGKVPQHQYFIVTGIMRKFYIDDLGEEITTDINNEPRFFTSYYHFANRILIPTIVIQKSFINDLCNIRYF